MKIRRLTTDIQPFVIDGFKAAAKVLSILDVFPRKRPAGIMVFHAL